MSRFISIADARAGRGLRMACLRGVPSPWTEAAKGIFHIKALDCQYAAQREDEDNAIAAWAGNSSVPVVAYDNEPLRTGWVEILLLAERLAPEPALIPEAADQRALMFGLAHEICGEMGFGWCLRLHMLKQSLSHDPASGEATEGFPPQVTNSLAGKYGFYPADVANAKSRAISILSLLDDRLSNNRYLLGSELSAVDVYWATFANMLTPLPEDLLPAARMIRSVYNNRDPDLGTAMTQRLRDHQRQVYEQHLELPVPL